MPRAPWANSDRRQHLPSNWTSLSKHIIARDETCQLAYPGTWWHAGQQVTCTGIATECDHVGHRDDHRPHMLRGACHNCHTRRTLEQSHAARRVRAELTRQPPEPHPGLN